MGLSSLLKNAEGGMLLYNVTFDLSDKRTVLEPYIPLSAAEGEDRVTPRVCLSDSIERCICALAAGNRELKVGQRLRVRQVSYSSIDPDFLVSYEELQRTGRVPDAVENHEYWALCPVNITVNDFTIKSFDHEFAVNWKSLSVEALKRIATGYVDKKVCVGRTAYDVYSAVSRHLEQTGRYDDSDDFWEDIIELPWAQGHKITNLVLA